MTPAELDKQKRKVAVYIERLRLIDRVFKVARLGVGKAETHSCHVHEKYVLMHDQLQVKINDGWSMFGGGDFEVRWQQKVVFAAHRASKAEAAEIPIREVKSHSIDWAASVFIDGEWVALLRQLATKGLPKTQAVKQEVPVPSDIEQSLTQNFKLPVEKPKVPKKPFDPFNL